MNELHVLFWTLAAQRPCPLVPPANARALSNRNPHASLTVPAAAKPTELVSILPLEYSPKGEVNLAPASCWGMLMQRSAIVGGAIRRRRILEHIELLCTCGVGLEAIASALTAAVRDLIGAASGSIFWTDEAGQPAGFYHDCAPAELKDLFVTRFEELFDGPEQITMRTLTMIEGPSIGRMLDPANIALFLSGNVYRHLSKPLGHHHLLDRRIEANGMGRAA